MLGAAWRSRVRPSAPSLLLRRRSTRPHAAAIAVGGLVAGLLLAPPTSAVSAPAVVRTDICAETDPIMARDLIGGPARRQGWR